MKKIILYLFVLIICLSSCTYTYKCDNEQDKIYRLNDRDASQEIANQIVISLVNDDVNELSQLLSYSLKSEDDIETKINDFLNYFEGDVIEIIDDGNIMSERYHSEGKKTNLAIKSWEIRTDIALYRIYSIIFTKAEHNPNDLGVYILGIAKINESEENETPWPSFNGILDVKPNIYISDLN